MFLLDGDRLRCGLNAGLGFSDADRNENLRRAAEVARLGVENGLLVVASFITPREEQRRCVRAIIGADAISLVWISTPLAVCRQRDVKGLYAAAATGAVKQMTGVSAGFEAPRGADLELDAGAEPRETSIARLEAFVRRRLQPAYGLACRS
jgi:adenylylsulfate kinase